MKTRIALVIGQRMVLAMTCWACGDLRPGDQFGRFGRGVRGAGLAYIDRRCRPCRWRHLEQPGARTAHV